ncbi:NAD(P)-binding protein [Glonium stellatum]|uniref:NAD(P)-binding protein n=1 Tax=Glonium stellatum TaxID=574774 RepID=A0A8E2EWU4_9PEZI|nr:NAD(P)-binding protein [Glonium stellatum]
MESPPSMLFLGASGQTGGPFLTVFRREYPNIPITVFLRSTALDAAIEALGGVTIAHGDFSDLEAIEKLSSNHNIVLNCATSTNAPVTAAILRGIRNTKTPKKPILHHLSGAGNFVDGSTSGTYVPQPRPWNDGNPDDVRNITAALTPNGACDELILKAAAAEGYVDAFFVCPGGIYGASANHIGVAAGAAAALAPGVWVGWMMDSIATLGFSPYVGDGTAKALDTWDSCRPEDVYGHFYLCVDETVAAKDVASAFADVAYRVGTIPAPTVKPVPYEEAGTVAKYLAGNMLLQDDNARSLGWKPKGPGLFETLKQIK